MRRATATFQVTAPRTLRETSPQGRPLHGLVIRQPHGGITGPNRCPMWLSNVPAAGVAREWTRLYRDDPLVGLCSTPHWPIGQNYTASGPARAVETGQSASWLFPHKSVIHHNP